MYDGNDAKLIFRSTFSNSAERLFHYESGSGASLPLLHFPSVIAALFLCIFPREPINEDVKKKYRIHQTIRVKRRHHGEEIIKRFTMLFADVLHDMTGNEEGIC